MLAAFPCDRIPSHSSPMPHCMVVNMDKASVATQRLTTCDSFADWPPAMRNIYVASLGPGTFITSPPFSTMLAACSLKRSASCGKPCDLLPTSPLSGWNAWRQIIQHIDTPTDPEPDSSSSGAFVRTPCVLVTFEWWKETST
ncbi:hypothetical protein niasHT_016579 [Heterodera trifolii]|uniref:Uncharacterized protein n=1 Tax=Heterodera trifolii TaxID=157864 RepID=A0ABD2LCM0_9BILA